MKRRIALETTTSARFPDVARAFNERVRAETIVPTEFEVHVTGSTTVKRRVRVDLLKIRKDDHELVCDVAARDQHHPKAFPTLAGTLVVRGTDDGTTELWLFGEYTHPLGPLGAVGGAITGERLARASLEAMFGTLVKELTDAAEAGAVRWHPPEIAEPLIQRHALQ